MDTRAVTTESIILRGRDYGETDRILIVLTKKFGKLPTIAKGVRKSSSKLKAYTQLFTYSKLTINLSGKSNMGIITQGETIDSLRGLRTDLTKIACASYVGEMIDISMEDHKANDALFVLTATVLTVLEYCTDPYLILKYFELKLLAILGYRPYLEKCLVCGRGLPLGDFMLSPARGGVVCRNCAGTYQGAALSPGAVLTMNKIMTGDLKKNFNLKISPMMQKEIDNAVYGYLDFYLDKSAKARAALQEYLFDD